MAGADVGVAAEQGASVFFLLLLLFSPARFGSSLCDGHTFIVFICSDLRLHVVLPFLFVGRNVWKHILVSKCMSVTMDCQ